MKNSSGSNNNNFGKKWSEERKRRQSELIKSKINDEYRKKCANGNKGKIFSEERRKNISLGHLGISRLHTEESKKKIGLKSKEKFTEEFKTKQRKLREEKGYWIPLKDKSDFEIYYKEANWVERMWDLFEDKRLKSIGIFNMKTNSKGLVRDHMFSRKSGFELGVFPEILRHPCNCQLITHAENISKKKYRYRDDDNVEINDLFDKIKKYDRIWKEQKLVLQKIEEYEMGSRYNRKESHDDK